MRRILVTGGAGFIGCNFVHYWAKHHPQDKLIVLDSLTYAGNLDNLATLNNHANYGFVKGNICDSQLVEQVMQEMQIDTIMHFAAESHVDRSIEGPDVFIQTNIVGTQTLLSVARKIWQQGSQPLAQHRFHHISTDEVYGSLKLSDPAFTETTAYAPNSPYAASKAASDHLVRAYYQTYGLQVTISNCSNNFGRYQHEEKLIPTIVRHLLSGQAIPIYGDGKNIRDWLCVQDHCRALELILLQGVIGETYNVGGDNEWDNLSLCKFICELVDQSFAQDEKLREKFPGCPGAIGKPCETLISFVTDRLGHDRRYAVDASKIKKDLGFEPSDFEQPLTQLINTYLHD